MSEHVACDTTEKPKGPTPTGFCWVEIPVKDMQRALKFYNEAFGWTPDSMMASDFYTLVSNKWKNLNGALRKVSEEEHVTGTAKTQCIKAFIGLENIKGSVESIKKAGGEIIIECEEIPNNMGFTAEFYDSERNVIGIWAFKKE